MKRHRRDTGDRMPSYETSLSITAPCEAVWPVMSNVAAWAEWLPTVTQVIPLDGDSLRPGSRFIVHQPGARPATWTVTEVEPPHRFIWVARYSGMTMTAVHTLTADSPSGSVIVLKFVFSGFLGAILGRMFGPLTQNYITQEATALKRKVETSL